MLRGLDRKGPRSGDSRPSPSIWRLGSPNQNSLSNHLSDFAGPVPATQHPAAANRL